MADNSPIEWTDATWNPVRGCTRVSPGCGGPGHAGGCYAESVAARFSDPGQPYHGFAERGRPGSKWTGKVALIEEQLALPLRWKKPRRIFVNSMSDLFHEGLPDAAIDQVFAVMARAHWHTFQVLTKRAHRMRRYFDAARGDRVLATAEALDIVARLFPWPLQNVWLGVSVEDQARADERIPDLLATPAAVRFLSCEPLLGPVDLTQSVRGQIAIQQPHQTSLLGIDWVIAGGESGAKARPSDVAWFQSLRDQCAATGTAFHFKQHGEWLHHSQDNGSISYGGDRRHVWHEDQISYRVGKKAAGRVLDGRTHDEFPRTTGEGA